MTRKRKSSAFSQHSDHKKPIKYFADYQLEWDALIPTLRKYQLEKVDFLSITGDAPKDFVTDSEYRPGYRSRSQKQDRFIAKVGSKFYPNESIVEQMITRIGQTYGLKIADSKLRMVVGQVRFMSKFFLKREVEQLAHGAEIFAYSLGKENYVALQENKKERDYFTFQMTEEAIKESFPGYEQKIMQGFVEMITFDALIGHNDRHPYNWGVIVPIKKGAPRFSPVYDTARAFFWNVPETRVRQMLSDQQQLAKYVSNCQPPIGWDTEQNVAFFRLIGLIWCHFARYRRNVDKFLGEVPLTNTLKMIDKEFNHLMSAERRELIKRCLHQRQRHLVQTVAEFRAKEELT
ncbi:MAG: HipA domain-containing protein [Acidobacteria bacterium]|nr:HipA domain-containing protein [Acidobacteriota bacterium]